MLLRNARVVPRRAALRRPYSSEAGGQSGFSGAQDNAFNRERKAVKDHAAATSDLWRKLSIYVVVPSLILGGANAWRLWTEHWEHWEHELHEHPMEERPQFQYQNIRTKNYPWGDGDKTAFWNDKVNYHKKDE
ncbi:mitochondrial cytochrome c oxidase subunit VIa, partial [Viridothelium virens]